MKLEGENEALNTALLANDPRVLFVILFRLESQTLKLRAYYSTKSLKEEEKKANYYFTSSGAPLSIHQPCFKTSSPFCTAILLMKFILLCHSTR